MSKTREKKPPDRLKLWLLQSALCLAAVLLVWLLRLSGGSVYEELRAAFLRAMEQNAFTPSVSTTVSSSTTTTATTTTTITTATTTDRGGTTPTATGREAP